MSDMTTLTGIVASEPYHRITSDGLAITSFRLASGNRRFDKEKKGWVDGETNWYTVKAFRHLAYNTAASLRKGEHVLVTGRLHVRNWESDERKGTTMDVEADAIGHDLFWCTTSFARNAPRARLQDAAGQYDPEEFGARPTGDDRAAGGSLAAEPAASPADWMANPDRSPGGWSAAELGGPDDAGVPADLADPVPEDPYQASADGFLPESETGMATLDS
ncbi:single-stranded DNA-binding protein [Glaciibacter sp. 2TAF33]|uniref:single-stranded DNA-binding protein n=1 Tax=Glaciibacter sp. 2TAF33 TaxID=3233015 RepID=UPI003F906EE5